MRLKLCFSKSDKNGCKPILLIPSAKLEVSESENRMVDLEEEARRALQGVLRRPSHGFLQREKLTE